MEQPHSVDVHDPLQVHDRPIKYSELPWEEKATLMWSWYWRAFIIGVLTIWSSNFFGSLFFIYVEKVAGGLDPLVLQALSFIVAAIVGYLGTHPLIQLVTRSNIGSYRIVIVRKLSSK